MLSKKLLVALFMLCVADSFAFQSQPPACELCGTWILVDRIDRTLAGQVVDESSLGSDPLGIIVYDRAGNVAAQLMKRNRGADAPSPGVESRQGTNNSRATGGYDAYFGKYVVDANAHTVTHQLQGAIAPADVGKTLVRSYELSGGELRLTFETTNNGVQVRRTLRWRRAA